MDFRRQPTAKQRLKIDWNYPVFAPDLEREVEQGRTSSGRALVALPRERAVAEIRAPDRRPLLVVRECGLCQGTDDALLNRRMNNEKTLLLTRWFRCIKLPNNILEENHPFHALFAEKHPPHLFLCRWDGSEMVPLSGEQTQAELWRAMTRLIGLEYERDVDAAIKELAKILNEYDTIDGLEIELKRQLEETLDKKGPKSSRVKSLRRKLERLAKRRQKVEASEQRVLDLGLKPLPEAAAAPGGGKTAG